MSKNTIFILFIILLDIMSFAHSENQGSLYVDEFGSTFGKPINTGFFFLDGKYLDAPYTVSRQGLAIFVNDVMITPPMPWPVAPQPSGIVDPPLPSNITTNTSFFDDTLRTYLSEKHAYIEKHFQENDIPIMFENVLRDLPCVDTATNGQHNTLHITTFRGENIPCCLSLPKRKGIDFSKRENILSFLENKRLRYEKDLIDGDCVIITDHSGSVSVGHDLKTILQPMLNILNSDQPDETKCSMIHELKIFSRFSLDDLQEFVINTRATSNLLQRVNALP